MILKEEPEGVLIRKQNEDPTELLNRMSNKATKKRKGKKLIINSDKDYSGQFEKRAKRSSIK